MTVAQAAVLAAERSAGELLLEVSNIEVVYNKSVQVLRGLSLAVPRGQIVALLGSNGAGKSTTLKAISNLLGLQNGEMTGGQVSFAGASTHGTAPHRLVRDGLFHVMEGRHVFEDLTVEENLVASTYALTGRHAAQADFDSVYEYFPRLFERRRGLAGYLSGGEQQMLAIGRALVAAPRLMLLDEPSLGLAPMLVEEIFEIVQRLNREQKLTVLLVEQNAALALGIADHGYVMENGRIVLEGSAEALRGNADIKEFYLGLTEVGARKSYRDVKHYKRRKRWLS